jgi:hypothetical protein
MIRDFVFISPTNLNLVLNTEHAKYLLNEGIHKDKYLVEIFKFISMISDLILEYFIIGVTSMFLHWLHHKIFSSPLALKSYWHGRGAFNLWASIYSIWVGAPPPPLPSTPPLYSFTGKDCWKYVSEVLVSYFCLFLYYFLAILGEHAYLTDHMLHFFIIWKNWKHRMMRTSIMWLVNIIINFLITILQNGWYQWQNTICKYFVSLFYILSGALLQ